MKLKEEVRIFWQGELVMPNPTEYCKNTRSYEDMRLEHELLHGHELSQEELELLYMRLKSHEWPIWPYYTMPIVSIPILLLLTFR